VADDVPLSGKPASSMGRPQALWHGTQTTWLPGIVQYGLGARNPHDTLGTLAVLRRMVKALEDNGADLPGPAPGIPNELRLVAGTVPPITHEGRPVNFQYGDTYVSLDEKVATRYATKMGGELYGYTWEAALRLQALDLLEQVPTWRGWALGDRVNIPLLLRVDGLGPNQLRDENGANLSPEQRRMLSGHHAGGKFRATDLTFRLAKPVPADALRAVLVQPWGQVPACPACLVRANPDHFPDLPSHDVSFDPGRPAASGAKMTLGVFSDCEALVHQ
jgi:hypothetical protein